MGHRCWHPLRAASACLNFTGGVFHGGRNVCDTLGGGRYGAEAEENGEIYHTSIQRHTVGVTSSEFRTDVYYWKN